MADEKKAAASEGRNYVEEGSVDDTIKNAKGVDPGAELGIAPVQSTTKVQPSKADESSAPGPYQGEGAPKVEDPPVRAGKPDTPIAQVLADGAGAHTPPDPKEFAPSGRPREIEEG